MSTTTTATDKHSNRKMIAAKINDMSVVIFEWYFSSYDTNNEDGKKWFAVSERFIPCDERPNIYFACLAKHHEACLHWLNGGEVERKVYSNWSDNTNLRPSGETEWSMFHEFMLNTSDFRIKPNSKVIK